MNAIKSTPTRKNVALRMENYVRGAILSDVLNSPEVFTPDEWTELEVSPHLGEWVALLGEAEASARKLRLRLQALQTGEAPKICAHCGTEFYGRADAKYCSTSHRVMGNR